MWSHREDTVAGPADRADKRISAQQQQIPTTTTVVPVVIARKEQWCPFQKCGWQIPPAQGRDCGSQWNAKSSHYLTPEINHRHQRNANQRTSNRVAVGCDSQRDSEDSETEATDSLCRKCCEQRSLRSPQHHEKQYSQKRTELGWYTWSPL